MRSVFSVLIASATGLGVFWAAPAAAQFEPTRMQRCSDELASLQGEARRAQLGECLRRRLEGEKIVERDCKKQIREAAVDLGAAKEGLYRQCLQRSLQLSYTELPRRPVALPKPPEPGEPVASSGEGGASPPDRAAAAAAALTP